MRRRVALGAALLNLLTCIILLIVFIGQAARVHDQLLEDELSVTCRLSAEALDSAAFMDIREEYLIGVHLDDSGMNVVYMDANGTVAYTSEEQADDALVAQGLKNRADGLNYAQGALKLNGKQSIYVMQNLKDGSMLIFAKQQTTRLQFMDKYIWRFVPISFVVVLLQFFIIYNFVGRSDRMVETVMEVLDDFSEGRFESRITSVDGFGQKAAAKYNATLARVQERVFSQQRRNRVVFQMLNQMRNGLITVDEQLNLIYASSNTVDLLGADGKNGERRPVAEVFNNEPLENALKQAIESGAPQMMVTDMDGLNKEGNVIPVRVHASSLFQGGKCTGAMAVIENISNIRRLEQIRNDFAANVSHEMKTPLTSIKGYCETLEMGAIDNPVYARKFLGIIRAEADRMYSLVEDIMSITKMESGKEQVELTRQNVQKRIYKVIEQLVPQAQQKQVTVRYRSGDEPVYVMANERQFEQVLVNLIENAIKYNKDGGEVNIYLAPNHNTGTAVMTVADTGIGIKPEHLDRLFERFYRVDKGRSRNMGGTGLGLAIVKHIVESLGWSIEPHSKYGEGTEFVVTMKLAPEENSAENKEEN